MKVSLDVGRCISSGACVVEAPDTFELDDSAIVRLVREPAGEHEEQAVTRAAAACPAWVISHD